MGRFAVSGTAFVTLLVGVFWAGGAATQAAMPEPATANYAVLFDHRADARLQLWGTSHTLHGVNPCAMGAEGEKLRNFALNAATPTFYRAWYADWRRYHAPPARVYLGLDPLFCTRFPWSRQYEQDSAFWPWGRFIERLMAPDEGAATAAWNRLALIRRRDDLQDRLAGVRSRFPNAWDQACAGFVPLEPLAGPGGPGPTAFKVDDAFVDDLRRLLQILRADRVELVGFQTPEFRAQVHGYAPQNRRLLAVVREFGVPFLNYNVELASDLNDDPTLFNDAGHLNARGAKRFSRRFATDLHARKLL